MADQTRIVARDPGQLADGRVRCEWADCHQHGSEQLELRGRMTVYSCTVYFCLMHERELLLLLFDVFDRACDLENAGMLDGCIPMRNRLSAVRAALVGQAAAEGWKP